jgi:hypothetical protein
MFGISILDSFQQNFYCAVSHVEGGLHYGSNARPKEIFCGKFVECGE